MTEIPPYNQIPLNLKRGDTGPGVRILQEWLCLAGQLVKVDGDFGPATERALVRKVGRPVVNDTIADFLTEPMVNALNARGDILDIAAAYLREHPREVGGQNRGPWVRLFTGGHEGPEWAWCACYCRHVAKQANHPLAWRITPSCDVTAANFAGLGRLGTVPEVGGLFLVRRAPGDWTHMGIVVEVGDGWIRTNEGNTNDEGSREGHEVCERTRGIVGLDFVRLA